MMLLGSLVNMLAIFAGCFVGVTAGKTPAAQKAAGVLREYGLTADQIAETVKANI